MGNYDFEFSEHGPYGAALRLLDGTDLGGRLVLDIGCGAASVADPLRDRGATYVGVDLDEDMVAKLVLRGFEGHQVDLTAPGLQATLAEIVAGRNVAAVLCLDVLEHVGRPEEVLAALTAVLGAEVELVASIPNVGHIDLARQLLCGTWETTDSGLLDRTHLRFFTHQSLTRLMAEAGWYEGAREDFTLVRSDQNRAGHPVFETGTNVGAYLGVLRSDVDDHSTVNQFVRRYHRGAKRPTDIAEPQRPFLSIVIRTQGQRPAPMSDVLCCLAAQTDQDYEILLVVHDSTRARPVQELVDQFDTNLGHRVRVLPVDGGTRSRPANTGLRAAAGEYIVFLDDDDLVTANWVENIRAGAAGRPGAVVRWFAAEQQRTWGEATEIASHAATGPLTPTYATNFDLIRHLRQNETPFHCFAIPRVLVELGFQFDESLTVCEDWDFLVRAAALCGVHDTEEMTSIYNKWSGNSSSHAVNADEWSVMRAMIHVKLDERPLLLPPGSVRQLDAMIAEKQDDVRNIQRLHAELIATQQRLEEFRQVSDNAHLALGEMRSSASWKASAPLRWFGRAARVVLRRR
ncbi:MAG: methyltransferase domain-containing protein [Kibdelosporangium sp.]